MARKKPKKNYKPSPLKDNCQTPPYAVIPIQQYLQPHWKVWEPAAGQGYLARALKQHVWAVIETDILTGQDFFADNPLALPQGVHAIITNPPGSTKYKWLAQCCWYWTNFRLPFALLMPTETAFAAKGARLVEAYSIEIIAPTKRVNYKMPLKGWGGDAQFHSSWFTVGFNVGNRLTYFDMSDVDMSPPVDDVPGMSQLSLPMLIEDLREGLRDALTGVR